MSTNIREHAHRVYSVLEDHNSAGRSAIAASWSRSFVQHGLDPEQAPTPTRLTEIEFRDIRQKCEAFVASARETIDRLYQSVGSQGCCVVLSDANGVILDRRSNDNTEFPDLVPGAIWSEAVAGTNGVGTSLCEGRALTIHKEQHFLARHIDLSCTAAPIRDESGRIMGALDVSIARNLFSKDKPKLLVNAICDAAQRIETRRFRDAFCRSRIIVLPDQGQAPGGMIAVDRYDLVIGANYAARRTYDITDRDLANPFPADKLLAPDQSGMDDLDSAEYGTLQRAIFRAGGNVSLAAQSLGISRQTLHRKLARFKSMHAEIPGRLNRDNMVTNRSHIV